MKPEKMFVASVLPQAGETIPPTDAADVEQHPKFAYRFGEFVRALPPKVRGIIATHVLNRNCPIVPDDEGAFPEDCVACVRDRSGLIAYAEDGAGRRLEGSLADFGTAKKPARKKRAKKAAGRSQSDPSPETTQSPPPPPAGADGDAGGVSG